MGMFLSLAEEESGIFVNGNYDNQIVPLHEFFRDSLFGMSDELAEKYACEFIAYAEVLRREIEKTPNTCVNGVELSSTKD